MLYYLVSMKMASVTARTFAMATLMPPTTPANKHKLGRFCVRVATSIIDNNGLKRMAFKGYGPEKATILDKTIKARDKHKRPDESSTEPLVTTIEICDVCDNRIEVHNIRDNNHYYLLSTDPCSPS